MATCTTDALAITSACFNCLSLTQQLAVQVYLLQQIATNTATAGQLLDSAKCFTCLTDHQLRAIQAYLLCQILG